MLRTYKLFLLSVLILVGGSAWANTNNSLPNESFYTRINHQYDDSSLCMNSFNETRVALTRGSAQSIIILSGDGNIFPFISLHSLAHNGNRYVLWQSLNGDIRGYALRNGKGFDYVNVMSNAMPLTWHPTLIWDNLFGSDKELKNYSCVLTGRTRVMGKKVSLIRLIPQEGLRFSFIVAKDDESDFPIELTLIDNKGSIASRLTTIESRSIGGGDFPVQDEFFDQVLARTNKYRLNSIASRSGHIASQSAYEPSKMISDKVILNSDIVSKENKNSLESSKEQILLSQIGTNDNQGMGASLNNQGQDGSLAKSLSDQEQMQAESDHGLIWPELKIPSVYSMVGHGRYYEGGPECRYQEFSDGITSFRVYRNKRSSIFYPKLKSGSLSIVRKNILNYEFAVVGEVPEALADYVLSKTNE